MKFSSKILKCQLSPVRKFNPCADQAVAAGRTIYHPVSYTHLTLPTTERV